MKWPPLAWLARQSLVLLRRWHGGTRAVHHGTARLNSIVLLRPVFGCTGTRLPVAVEAYVRRRMATAAAESLCGDFEELWAKARKAPLARLNNDEADFMKEALASNPRYSPYVLYRPNAAQSAVTGGKEAPAVLHSFQHFTPKAGNITWADAFDCLAGIGRLSLDEVERSLFINGRSSPEFASLVAYCCSNLRRLSPSEYRQFMALVGDLQWEQLPGKPSQKCASTNEYKQQLQLATQACTQGSAPPPTRGSVVSTSLVKFHLAYTLMAEHVRRMHSWSIADVFYHTDVFNAMLIASTDTALRSYYAKVMTVIEALVRAYPADNVPVEVLVMVAYTAGASRFAPRSIMTYVEHAVRRQWAKLTLPERAVFALGFFKSQHKFTSRLQVCNAYDTARIVGNGKAAAVPPTDTFNSFVVSSLVKQCAYSVDRLQVALHDNVRTAMLRCYAAVVPAAPLTVASRCVHSMVVTRQVVWPVVEAFVRTLSPDAAGRSMQSWRMKDIALVLFSLGSLQYSAAGSTQLYKLLLADITSQERLSELRVHPRRAITALVGLSYLGFYPHSIYSWMLRNDFVEFAQRHLNPEDVQVLRELSACIAIDAPSYSGPLLAPLRGSLTGNAVPLVSAEQSVTGKESAEESSRRLVALKNIEDVLIDVLPPPYDTRIKQLLPHFPSSDIEIVRAESSTTAAQKLAVMLYGDNEFFKVYEDTSWQKPPQKRLTGRCALKLRHLKTSGYTVAQVPVHEFEASKDKKAYIKHLLNGILS